MSSLHRRHYLNELHTCNTSSSLPGHLSLVEFKLFWKKINFSPESRISHHLLLPWFGWLVQFHIPQKKKKHPPMLGYLNLLNKMLSESSDNTPHLFDISQVCIVYKTYPKTNPRKNLERKDPVLFLPLTAWQRSTNCSQKLRTYFCPQLAP